MKRKTVLALLAALVMLQSVVSGADTQSHSWYFKPAKNHQQPQIIPQADIFAEKYDTIFIGSPEEKKVYLTFDAGYENGNVGKILDVLKEKNVSAAFFILPQVMKENADLVHRMKAEGHLVCNHTAHHKDMSKITDYDTFAAELIVSEDKLRQYTGIEMDKFYRPPEGRFSEQNLEYAKSLGYKTVFWSLAYADWDNAKQLDPQKALALILARTHPGCVALLHPTSSTNAAILGDYIDTLRADGYTFASLADFEVPNNAEEDVAEDGRGGESDEETPE